MASDGNGGSDGNRGSSRILPAARDGNAETVSKMLSTAGAQSLINYQHALGARGNRVTNDHRQMLGNRKHRKTLSQMLALTDSNTFKEFSWDSTHTEFVDFVQQNGPEVLWLIRLERKNEEQRVARGFDTEELWEAQNTQELIIKDGDKVRYSCKCLLVRNVFLNWSARSPEVQFCFPICSDSLKTLLVEDHINFRDLQIVREISGQHVRNILEFDQYEYTEGGQNAVLELYSVSDDCRKLLSLILWIVDESLKTKSAPIEAASAGTVYSAQVPPSLLQ